MAGIVTIQTLSRCDDCNITWLSAFTGLCVFSPGPTCLLVASLYLKQHPGHRFPSPCCLSHFLSFCFLRQMHFPTVWFQAGGSPISLDSLPPKVMESIQHPQPHRSLPPGTSQVSRSRASPACPGHPLSPFLHLRPSLVRLGRLPNPSKLSSSWLK